MQSFRAIHYIHFYNDTGNGHKEKDWKMHSISNLHDIKINSLRVHISRRFSRPLVFDGLAEGYHTYLFFIY
jgi:hypothetical protein